MENIRKITFFDFDFTLCVHSRKPQIFSEENPEGLAELLRNNGKDLYADSRPLECMKKYAEKLKREGNILYVLTFNKTPFYEAQKKRFLEKHYPGLFDGRFITVGSKEMKIAVMKAYALAYHAECELVEDDNYTIGLAKKAGFKATRVSRVAMLNETGLLEIRQHDQKNLETSDKDQPQSCMEEKLTACIQLLNSEKAFYAECRCKKFEENSTSCTWHLEFPERCIKTICKNIKNRQPLIISFTFMKETFECVIDNPCCFGTGDKGSRFIIVLPPMAAKVGIMIKTFYGSSTMPKIQNILDKYENIGKNSLMSEGRLHE